MNEPDNRLTKNEVQKLGEALALIERGELDEAKRNIQDVLVSAAPVSELWNGKAVTRADRGFWE